MNNRAAAAMLIVIMLLVVSIAVAGLGFTDACHRFPHRGDWQFLRWLAGFGC